MFGWSKSLKELIFMEQSRHALWAAVNTLGFKRSLDVGWENIKSGALLNFIIGKRDKAIAPVLCSVWDSLGDRDAVVSGSKHFSFSEFKERTFRMGNSLSALGIKKPDKVALMLFNGNEFLECVAGCTFLGCPNPAVNWHLTGKDLAAAVNRSAPQAFIFDYQVMEEVLSVKDEMPGIKHYIVVGAEANPIPDGILDYEKMLEKAPVHMPDGQFMISLNPYTGGTTGVPKSINYYEAYNKFVGTSEEKNETGFLEFLKLVNKQLSMIYYFNSHQIKDIRSLVVSPIYHAGALAGVIPFCLGGTLVMTKKFDPEEVLAIIEKEKISWFFSVPTMLQRILALPEEILNKYDLSSMETLISAAAHCPLEVKEKINALFMRQGAKRPVFYEYYGAAESGIITMLIPEDYRNHPERLRSVGKTRGGELIILDKDGCPVKANEKGRVHLRSLITVVLRYVGSEEKLSDIIKVIDGKEYYDDGLVGYLDDDGFLYLTGREKELIIMGGVNIYPVEIEEKILKHDDVIDVAVLGIPDPDLGEMVHAEIELKKGRKMTKQAMLEHCKEVGLFGFKIPRSIAFVKKLPRHIDGKIFKRQIKDKYWSDVEEIG